MSGAEQEAGEAGGNQGTTLTFGFAKKKVVQKVAVNLDEAKVVAQTIKTIEGSVITVDGPDPTKGKTYVIPKIENTYKTGVGSNKFTPSFKPPASDVVTVKDGEDRFVLGVNTAPTIAEYGLQVRSAPKEGAAVEAQGNGHRLTSAQLDDRAFKSAVEELPEDPDIDAYDAMPIEEFGKAMLRGMGWQEGMGVGRNRKVAEAIEYVKRPERLGLGAMPVALPEDKSKQVKMGDKPKRTDMVLPPDADGRQRNIRTLDEKLVPRAQVQPGPQPGKQMIFLDGRHAGMSCTVLQLLPTEEGRSERARVRLTASHEEVEVRAKELGERWEQPKQQQSQQQPNDRKERSSSRGAEEGEGGRDRDSDGARDGGRRDGAAAGRDDEQRDERRVRDGSSRDNDRERERDRGSKRERERDRDGGGDGGREWRKHKDKERERDGGKRKQREDGDHPPPASKASRRAPGSDSDGQGQGGGDGNGGGRRRGPTWLFPNIKVRIVDKSVRGGKVYLKKGVVVDVHPGGTADVAVDDTGDVLKLPDAALETVVPKHEGAAVLIVAGQLRGQRARLLQCRTEDGVAAVQLAADFSIQRLMLDQVAQYVGHMDEDDG